jgi:adenosylmethionine-8-amino-7-oxononanoate aminotransferase
MNDQQLAGTAADVATRYRELLLRTFIDYQQTSEFVQHPLILKRAQGLYYWDLDGKRYFDGIGGIFVATLGHGHPRVLEAAHKQLEVMTFAPPLHGVADVTLDFVERLGQVAPGNLTFVKPYSGGSESIESALKFTRQYFRQTGHPGKYKFISRDMAYHGGTFGAMAASGTGPRKAWFDPHLPGFLRVPPPTACRDRFSNWDECNRFCARLFEDVILREDPSTVAGIILEPIGNTGGIITPTAEYFEIIRWICDRYQVLLIFDEVITGYARTGAMFAAQAYGVTPDIICGGKGLSSGVIPLGAMLARQDLGDAFYGPTEKQASFAHGHTFAGHPLACAVGLAVIAEIVEQRLDQQACLMGDYLASKLEKLKAYGVVREVRGRGMLRGVELVRDTKSMQAFPELGAALRRTALDNGLIMRIDPSWFALSPALIATRSDIDELCDLVERSLADALEKVRA